MSANFPVHVLKKIELDLAKILKFCRVKTPIHLMGGNETQLNEVFKMQRKLIGLDFHADANLNAYLKPCLRKNC